MAEIMNMVEIPLKMDHHEINSIFISFRGLKDANEHIAIKLGCQHFTEKHIPIIRIHSECLTGDVFGSLRCDCGEQLKESLEKINQSGGYLLYLRQEGRGIGLYKKIDSYVIQKKENIDTYEANSRLGFEDDLRDYTIAYEMLACLGVKKIRLLTNNPDKVIQLETLGMDIDEVIPTGVYLSKYNKNYLAAKKHKTNHIIHLQESLL